MLFRPFVALAIVSALSLTLAAPASASDAVLIKRDQDTHAKRVFYVDGIQVETKRSPVASMLLPIAHYVQLKRLGP